PRRSRSGSAECPRRPAPRRFRRWSARRHAAGESGAGRRPCPTRSWGPACQGRRSPGLRRGSPAPPTAGMLAYTRTGRRLRRRAALRPGRHAAPHTAGAPGTAGGGRTLRRAGRRPVGLEVVLAAVVGVVDPPGAGVTALELPRHHVSTIALQNPRPLPGKRRLLLPPSRKTTPAAANAGTHLRAARATRRR